MPSKVDFATPLGREVSHLRPMLAGLRPFGHPTLAYRIVDPESGRRAEADRLIRLPGIQLPGVPMCPSLVQFALASLACCPYPIDPNQPADPRADRAVGCYAVQVTGQVAPYVSLPGLIELSSEAAP